MLALGVGVCVVVEVLIFFRHCFYILFHEAQVPAFLFLSKMLFTPKMFCLHFV